jgi:ketosteroid isomerase-like protein
MAMTTRDAFGKGTDTFNAHDVEGFAEVLADDVVFRAPGGKEGKGRAACVEFTAAGSRLPRAHVEVTDLNIIDGVAVEEGTFTGTHGGILHSPVGDIPPTGRPVRLDYIQVLRFRDGEHVSFNLMFDRLVMLEQLGIIPTPAAAG